MEQDIPIAYNGEKAYIFISYAHKNMNDALNLICKLQLDGFRVWYDEGIDPGCEWDENISSHIEQCGCFIALLSREYLASSNCKDELNYARELEKTRLLIYLEDVQLPGGMRMRLGRQQAIHRYKYSEQDRFYEKLYKSQGIEDCRDLLQLEQKAKETVSNGIEPFDEQHNAIGLIGTPEYDETTNFKDSADITVDKKNCQTDEEDIEKIQTGTYDQDEQLPLIGGIIQEICYAEVENDEMSNWLKKQRLKNTLLDELIINTEQSVITEKEYSGKKFAWLIIGNKVKRISKKAFFDCGIQMVYIPSSVEVIEEYAFGNNNISFVLFEETPKKQEISSTAFCNQPLTRHIKYKEPCIVCDKDNHQIRDFCEKTRLKQKGFGPIEKSFLQYAREKIGQLCVSRVNNLMLEKRLGLLSETGIVNKVTIYDDSHIRGSYDYRHNDTFHVLVIKNIKKIPSKAFEGCLRLEYIFLDATVAKIEKEAFKGCVSLKGVVFFGDNENREIDDTAFNLCNNIEYFACLSRDSVVQKYCLEHGVTCCFYDNIIEGACPKTAREIIKEYKNIKI